MAKDREIPCVYYICAGKCEKGREASHTHYCQHCKLYKPRSKGKKTNTKKKKLENLEKNESKIMGY